MNELIGFLVLLCVGYAAGRRAEKRHFRSIEEREAALTHVPLLTFSESCPEAGVAQSRLVMGTCALSSDYFKVFLSMLESLFGGSLISFESVIDCARREALLRMFEDARGADAIYNVRVDTASINGEAGGRRRVFSVEVLASGTAVYGEIHP